MASPHDVLEAAEVLRDPVPVARPLPPFFADRQRVDVVVHHEMPRVLAPEPVSWWRGVWPLVGFFVTIAAVVVVTVFVLAFLHLGGPVHLPWEATGR